MTPFLIVKYAGRCGSHWLKSCLAAHPEIIVSGEQFDLEFACWRTPALWPMQIAKVFANLGGDGPCGFILKAGSISDPLWRSLRVELAKVCNLHIIMTLRRNYLDQYVSLMIAQILSHFDSSLDPIRLEPFLVDPRRVIGLFETWDKKISLYRQLFAALPSRDLYYEDLENDPRVAVADFCGFLGVKGLSELVFDTKKQRSRPAREMIVNFDELTKALRGSRWADIVDMEDSR